MPAPSQPTQSVSTADIVAAIALHVLLFLGLFALSQGSKKPPSKPALQVMSIHAVQQLKPKTPAAKAKRQAIKAKPKPQRHKTQAMPTIHAKAKPIAKPRPKKTTRPIKKKPIDPDFDPFKPLIEQAPSSEKTTPTPAKVAARTTNKTTLLSQSEIDHYIAGIQSAVQEHWKLPTRIDQETPDPIVEMNLAGDGSSVSLQILQSSGNSLLDASLIRAIQAAAPFQLPEKHSQLFAHNRMRFHPLQP